MVATSSKPLIIALTTSTNLRCLTRYSVYPQVSCRWYREAWSEAHLRVKIRTIAKAQHLQRVACKGNWDLRQRSSILCVREAGSRIWSHAQLALSQRHPQRTSHANNRRAVKIVPLPTKAWSMSARSRRNPPHHSLRSFNSTRTLVVSNRQLVLVRVGKKASTLPSCSFRASLRWPKINSYSFKYSNKAWCLRSEAMASIRRVMDLVKS